MSDWEMSLEHESWGRDKKETQGETLCQEGVGSTLRLAMDVCVSPVQ